MRGAPGRGGEILCHFCCCAGSFFNKRYKHRSEKIVYFITVINPAAHLYYVCVCACMRARTLLWLFQLGESLELSCTWAQFGNIHTRQTKHVLESIFNLGTVRMDKREPIFSLHLKRTCGSCFVRITPSKSGNPYNSFGVCFLTGKLLCQSLPWPVDTVIMSLARLLIFQHYLWTVINEFLCKHKHLENSSLKLM